jgi:hypothetical protein
MKGKKLYILIGLAAVLLIVAAFVAGRLLTGSGGGLLGLLRPGGGPMTSSVSMVPAPELPTTQPELTGLFAERQDNSIFVQSISMDAGMGGGGVVVSSSGGDTVTSAGGPPSGPQVEVVVTADTIIWRDATQPPEDLSSSGEVSIQQVVEAGSLDDLNSDSMVMVWGRKVGDRVIADVICFSNPIMLRRP